MRGSISRMRDFACRTNGKSTRTPRPPRRRPRSPATSGTRGSFRISRLPTITLPSNSTPGSERASEPVANMMCVASTSVILPVVFDLPRAPARPSGPSPACVSTLFLRKRNSMPLACLLTMLFLARQHRRPIELELGDLDAEFLGVLERVVDFGVVQQHLGGNAADVQAGAAEKAVLLDDQRLQSPLRGANGGDVAARSAADDRQIVFCQAQPPRLKSLCCLQPSILATARRAPQPGQALAQHARLFDIRINQTCGPVVHPLRRIRTCSSPLQRRGSARRWVGKTPPLKRRATGTTRIRIIMEVIQRNERREAPSKLLFPFGIAVGFSVHAEVPDVQAVPFRSGLDQRVLSGTERLFDGKPV